MIPNLIKGLLWWYSSLEDSIVKSESFYFLYESIYRLIWYHQKNATQYNPTMRMSSKREWNVVRGCVNCGLVKQWFQRRDTVVHIYERICISSHLCGWQDSLLIVCRLSYHFSSPCLNEENDGWTKVHSQIPYVFIYAYIWNYIMSK